MGGRFDMRRAGDPVESDPFAAPAAERAAGPPVRDDGQRLAEQVLDEGLERRGVNTW